MTQITLTKEEQIKALTEWSLQWTNEFLSSHVIPNMKKALENEFIVYCIERWNYENNNYKRQKTREIIESIESGQNKLTSPIIDNRARYSNNLYDFFAKVCK